MADLTAIIEVLAPSADGGERQPTHYLFLGENSRPVWELIPEPGMGRPAAETGRVVWVPTVDHMLEDALLMIGMYVLEDEALAQMGRKRFRNGLGNRVELYDDASAQDREAMYARCRQLISPCEIVVSTYEGSTVRANLEALQDYALDVKARFAREVSPEEWELVERISPRE